MAVEARRGCGYRKVGGLYLVGGGGGLPCCKLPVELKVCPCCGAGVKQNMGWSWVDPRPWLVGPCRRGRPEITTRIRLSDIQCPAADPAQLGDRVGLLWIGAGFYDSPDKFMSEARQMGVSRRIAAVPRGFRVGQDWVFLAHPRLRRDADTGRWVAGVFHIFRPTAIEKIMTESQRAALDEPALARLAARGVTPVVVPDDDRDHQGSVWDRQGSAQEDLFDQPGGRA